jgi:hypothetical protein
MSDGIVVRRIGTVVLGLGGVVVAALGGGVALASGQAGATIHSCVAKSDGSLRVVASASACTSHETPLSFNKRGPRGLPGAPGGSGGGSETFAMYANVDQNGNLGSNNDAVSAVAKQDGTNVSYVVTFSHPVGTCAAVAQSGFAGGDLLAVSDASLVTIDQNDDSAFDVFFVSPNGEHLEATAFMMTVTCKS